MQMKTGFSALIALLGTTGCFATKMSQTAETLGEGRSELALSFNTTQFTNLDAGGDVDFSGTVVPNLVPNVHYAVGINDNADFYGNLNPVGLATEFGVKYGVFRTEKSSLALAPMIGWSPMGALAATRFSLPVLFTQRISSSTALTLMGEGLYRRRGQVSNWSEVADSFVGDTMGVGGGIGLELKGRAFVVRPGLSFTYYSTDFSGADDSVNATLGQLGVTIGRRSGHVEEQLDRMEKKIDDLGK